MPESTFLPSTRETYEPRIHHQYILAIAAMREAFTLSELTELLQEGRIEEIFEGISTEFVRVQDIVLAAYLASGLETSKFIGEFLDDFVSFDQLGDRVVNTQRAESERLIQRLNAGQRAASLLALQDGLRRELQPAAQARNLVQSYGLTERQQTAVINYRRLLETNSAEALRRQARDKRFDQSVRRAIENKTPLRTEQIDKMVARYAARLVKQRAAVVARTEALRATEQAIDEMWNQAFDSGIVLPVEVEETWLTDQDELVRGTHVPMHGQVRAPGVPFTSGAGVPLRYPGDPSAPAKETTNCRCRKKFRLFRD